MAVTVRRLCRFAGHYINAGFVEAHSHFMLNAILLNEIVIPIDYTICKSIKDIQKIIQKTVPKRKRVNGLYFRDMIRTN